MAQLWRSRLSWGEELYAQPLLVQSISADRHTNSRFVSGIKGVAFKREILLKKNCLQGVLRFKICSEH